MALTNPPISIPEAVVTVPSARRHIAYGWIAVGVALLASVALVVALLAADGSSTSTFDNPWTVERGSITALDHSLPGAAGASSVTDRNLSDPGAFDRSITAIDHAATSGVATPTQRATVLDRGLQDPGSTDRG